MTQTPIQAERQVRLEPSGRTFTVIPGETVLEAAIRQGVGLPYGCRNGACGACKGALKSGSLAYGDHQERAITEAEKAAGKALTCCTKPLTDIVLEIRELAGLKDLAIRTLPARVEKIEKPAEDVAILYLKLPASERLQFLAGQYIDILLKDGRRRSFSIANAPETDECLELHVRRVPGGHFTTHVFETMKERDLLRLEGPHGGFHLREDGAKPVILLAGGTGFAPVKAMVEHAFHRQSLRPMTLYWGARDRAGLYLHELAEGWAAGRAGFDYVPVLSEPAAGDGWPGRTGLVHRAVMADFPDLSGHRVYACGAPAMIEAARSDLIGGCGLKEEDFFADSFTFATDSTRP